MIDLGQIEAIVATYDLSPKLSSRIIRTAAYRIEERGIVSFDEAYSLIAALIEKWQIIQQQVYPISLDSKQFSVSGDFLHEVIGVEDEYQGRFFERLEQSPQYNFKRVIEALDGKLQRPHIEVLNIMYQRINRDGDITFNINLEDLISDIDGVKQRLTQIISRFKANGRIVIPPVRILELRFNPLFIRFEERDFNDNPILYFQQNIDIYSGLSRSQLKIIDPFLYNALLKYNQLAQAIPNKKGETYRGYESPLAYYLAYPEKYKGLNPCKLQKLDPGLYDALRRKDQLYQAISQTKL